MAATKYRTPKPELTAGELSITLYPRQHDSWRGTAEQLTESGLIPDGFKWPSRTEHRSFTHKGIDCAIQRKPLLGGTRGRAWAGVDNWELVRYCEGRGNGGAELYEKQQALKHELWRRSPAGDRMFSRYWKAHEDSQFQAFMRLLGMPAGR